MPEPPHSTHDDVDQERRSWIGHALLALAASGAGVAVTAAATVTGHATTITTGSTGTQEVIQQSTTPPDAVLSEAVQDSREHAQRLLARRADVTPSEATTATTAKAKARKIQLGSLPVTSNVRVVARFHAKGVWARYHTGIDFAAPVGTPIHAVAAGVVTHAGRGGKAGGWAGKYVTIRHAGGIQTLYAHQSAISVKVGQRLRAGQVIGRVGVTGRSFGPHVHVELYPTKVKPGDIYKAKDPARWLRSLGVRF